MSYASFARNPARTYFGARCRLLRFFASIARAAVIRSRFLPSLASPPLIASFEKLAHSP